MKKLTTAALAALALTAIIPTSAFADDPVTPKQGAVCNLYLLDVHEDDKGFSETAATLATKPAAATFVDTASDFKPVEKRNDVKTSWGMWDGWFKQEKAGTYTFTCKRYDRKDCRYSIWINGQQCAKAWYGQGSFDVELSAGFNSVKIVAEGYTNYKSAPLTISYKKKGSVKEPVSFGPESMFYDDDDE